VEDWPFGLASPVVDPDGRYDGGERRQLHVRRLEMHVCQRQPCHSRRQACSLPVAAEVSQLSETEHGMSMSDSAQARTRLEDVNEAEVGCHCAAGAAEAAGAAAGVAHAAAGVGRRDRPGTREGLEGRNLSILL
jgi:hypothetical protein